ncbi:mitochondrial 54S ribosomal protein YmL6 [Coccidioides immitis RS]|uniref:Large ribosomal subunit protein uL4m n=3 Tax=Coccidioides immitis TaxID=5501 RepID=J3K203_COCIM|nr:mitochondrial 54S ribosomal protein YmL6 [Coccidioides immitis RS]EAS28074.3 50S ribosomal protein L4 [Coccidioides immitis RS]KMP08885.1 50S ribosomal protein L4 [Coccidioides immitis RMSCC 2394]KMU89123.1 50S ribosomal protein L4 [Coccidioides immitis H538.4]
MNGSKALGALKWLSRSCNWAGALEPPKQCLPKQLSRSMATETQIPAGTPLSAFADAHVASTSPNDIPTPIWKPTPAIATLYDFPTMEPLRFLEYKHEHLLLPLRRDILHRAVVYEGDMARQGTANTKWRSEVRGSRKKIRPQKGTGRARLGDKKSPMLRGGGVAHGPHPRDFSTELPQKIYDKAWRTALSYRYRRGQLIIVNDNISMPKDTTVHFLKEIFDTHNWGKKFGRSLLITEVKKEKLFRSIAEISEEARVLDREDVDVKDLLETGRLIIEKMALDRMLANHSSDLQSRPIKA